MSVKKILTAALAGSLISAFTVAYSAPTASNGKYYLEGSFGYAAQDFSTTHFSVKDSQQTTLLKKNAKGGMTFGADTGVFLTQHVALELGWSALPKVTSQPSSTQKNGFNVKDAWAGWLVTRFGGHFTPRASVFMKAGALYRYGKISFNQVANWTKKVHEVHPVVGLGFGYDLAPNMSASVSWMHVIGGRSYQYLGANNKHTLVLPSACIYALSLGYHFSA